MTEDQFRIFLSAAAWTCAVACVLNLLNLKRRGNSAFLLSGAFLTMAGISWLLRERAPTGLIVAAGLILATLLFLDFGYRSRQQQDRPR